MAPRQERSEQHRYTSEAVVPGLRAIVISKNERGPLVKIRLLGLAGALAALFYTAGAYFRW